MRAHVRVSDPTPASAPPKPLFLGFRVPLFFPTRTCCREHIAKHVSFSHSHTHRSQVTWVLGFRSSLRIYVLPPDKHAHVIAVPPRLLPRGRYLFPDASTPVSSQLWQAQALSATRAGRRPVPRLPVAGDAPLASWRGCPPITRLQLRASSAPSLRGASRCRRCR